MKYLLMACLLLLGWSAAGQPAAGQPAAADSVAAGRLAQHYQRSTQVESALLQGVEYVNKLPEFYQEHPFFLAALPQPGSLVYQGRPYVGVPLQYEEVQNCVVLLDTVRNVSIRLISEEITGFTIAGHRFVRLAGDSTRKTDFFEVLADGKARLLTTRHKQAVKRTIDRKVSGELVVTDRCYVEQAGYLTEVSRLKQLLVLLPEQRAALQQLARSQHLTGRGARREADFTALVRYYNTLAGTGTTPN